MAVQELLANGPNILGFPKIDSTNLLKLGAGAVGVGGGALAIFKPLRRVPEGYVGIRTHDSRALDKHDKPLHKLLTPGRHWMLPFFHDIDLVIIQDQKTLVATRVDLGEPEELVQFDLEAVVTWSVKKQQIEDSRRPVVEFQDAYKFYYGIDAIEDVEKEVAGVTTDYLLDCAQELEIEDRNRKGLKERVNDYLGYIDLNLYGVEVTKIDITNFSHTGVLRITHREGELFEQP